MNTSALLDLLRRSNAGATLHAYVKDCVDRDGVGDVTDAAEPTATADLTTFARSGILKVGGFDAKRTAFVAAVVRALDREGAPGVFAFLFPEAWDLAEELRRRIEERLGRPYAILDDAWAWSVRPGTRGWPPHRGGTRVYERRAPELVTGWLALADVAANQACMHAVPLDDDPGYPDLERVDGPLQAVRAYPLAAGTALFWNANVLHWGGTCDRDAAAPRLSCSVSFGRADVDPKPEGLRFVTPEELSAESRLAFVASQIVRYEAVETGLSEELVRWAKVFASFPR